MSEFHDGGCLCGAVRYRVKGNPLKTCVCHCTFCQRRTGSAFSLVIVFGDGQVEMNGDTLTEYEHRSDESHRWVRLQFCNRCGTTVACKLEHAPGVRVISGGTFDDPNWIKLNTHIWTRSAQHWMAFHRTSIASKKRLFRRLSYGSGAVHRMLAGRRRTRDRRSAEIAVESADPFPLKHTPAGRKLPVPARG